MREAFRKLVRDSRGVTAIEYGLLVAIIALACISSFAYFVQVTNGMWLDAGNKVASSTEAAAADLR